MSEHGFEPVRGLPERLPDGERILWQGAPAWRTLARHAFHLPLLALYFAVLLAWRALDVVTSGGSLAQAAFAASLLLPLALAACAIVAGFAWLVGRTTLYTITDRRVVMRVGVVLSITFNLPFKAIEAAGLRTRADGTGDLPLLLDDGYRIAYLHLWPHARPWQLRRPQPMLRAVPAAAAVANLLREALAATLPAGSRSRAVDGPAPAAARPDADHAHPEPTVATG